MPKISDSTVARIKELSKIKEVIEDYQAVHKSGSSFYTKCPECGKDAKNKGLIITPAKSIAKCFSCGFAISNSVTYLMKAQNLAYPEALKHLASKYNVFIQDDRPIQVSNKKKRSKASKKSFLEIQLAESGLSIEDVKARVFEDDAAQTLRETQIYRTGTRDQYNQLVPGDDMIIQYFDLEGNKVLYQKPNSTKFEHLYRVRWQNPELHVDKTGHPIKYSSPRGSGSHLYFPQFIRDQYRTKKTIHRLFIQEGEKKAEKATKHGIPSVGIMGIHNLGQNGTIPHEMQLLVKACGVKEIIFVLDADWDEISQNIKPSVRVDLRPLTFFAAVRNYRDYFKSFNNIGIHLETYFAYIKPNPNQDKGIDDLLVKTLNRKEDSLSEDIDKAINLKDGTGEYIQLHKISTLTDYQIKQFWHLDSPDIFAQKHKHILENFPEFLIGKHKWRFTEGKFESAQPLEEAEIYWKVEKWEDKNGRERQQIQFDYTNCYNFLQNRGFGRMMMASKEFRFAHQNGYVVKLVDSYQIKDFVMDFTKVIAPKDILNMMYRGGKMYLGPDSLSNMNFLNPEFEMASKDHQMLYFQNKAWKITSMKIQEVPLQELTHYVWEDKINKFDAKSLGAPLVDVIHENGKFDAQISKNGSKCHFLVFLLNASNFYWKEAKTREILDEEVYDTALHFVSKMTAMGYLLHSYKDRSVSKAVIAMDGKLSEIGSSHGRTGKSLFGLAVEQVIPLTYIAAKNKKITEDPFLFEEVSEKTEVVFLDDVRANLDFEFFFPLISGKLTVNQKGAKKFTLSSEQTPKLLISTNHAILGEGASFQDRQAFIAFSDFYNENHKPTDDFNSVFFDEWDYQQWNLFYNFMAECLQAYLKYGIVKSPQDKLELRRLRQTMGEVFLGWAEEYYSVSEDFDPAKNIWPDDCNLGRRISKKDLYNHFLDNNPRERTYTPITSFKKRLKAYAKYKGYAFNPSKLGKDDKAGGIEYVCLDRLSES
jgi:DNA primase